MKEMFKNYENLIFTIKIRKKCQIDLMIKKSNLQY